MNEKRRFKGIWIPRSIWLDQNLTIHEKVMLVEIDSLDNENGCYARNQHFCDFLGVNERRIQDIIRSLKDKGLITVTLLREPGKKAIKGRVLKITELCPLFDREIDTKEVVQKTAQGGAENCVRGGAENCAEVVQKTALGGAENCVVNNTVFNNTSISNTSNKSNKSATREKAAPVDLENIFSPYLAEKVRDWLQYKKERRETYKETGLKSLITEIKHNAEKYGDTAVADLINTCMAAGYRGIIFQKLKDQSKQKKTSNNPFLDMLREEEAKEANTI